MFSRLKKALPSLPGRKKKDGSSAPQGDGISNSEEAAAVSPANPSKSGEISNSATPATASASETAAVAAVGGFDTARRFTKAWDWGNDPELEQLIGDACCYSAQDGEFEGKAEVIEALRKDSLWGKHCVAIESGPSKGEAHGTVVTKISAKVRRRHMSSREQFGSSAMWRCFYFLGCWCGFMSFYACGHLLT